MLRYNIVAFRVVSRQQLGKYVPAATDTQATIGGTVGNGVFYSVCAKGL
jgi:hypothetical protein